MCNYMIRIIAYAVAGRKVTSIQYFGKRFFRQSVLCNAINVPKCLKTRLLREN